MEVVIPIRQLPEASDLPLPAYLTPGAAGLDLYAAVTEDVSLGPGERCLIPTGIQVAIPPGYEAQIRPRSGLALKYGITLLNTPGTIDSDYRGEIQVIVINLGGKEFCIRRGDRIAQMVINQVARVRWQPVIALPATKRGDGGFGHTGR
ncbi:MAG TPA: dUTP diphosphatase [Peptococcaceae bacterium]|nr:dUTP diphosphatase [Peptococcaceae bacterium]